MLTTSDTGLVVVLKTRQHCEQISPYSTTIFDDPARTPYSIVCLMKNDLKPWRLPSIQRWDTHVSTLATSAQSATLHTLRPMSTLVAIPRAPLILHKSRRVGRWNGREYGTITREGGSIYLRRGHLQGDAYHSHPALSVADASPYTPKIDTPNGVHGARSPIRSIGIPYRRGSSAQVRFPHVSRRHQITTRVSNRM